MTKQKACTLCGAGGHTAAQCNWSKALELLRAAKQFTWNLQSQAELRLRIDDFLASQQVEQHPEQAEGAQGEREAFEARFPIPEGIEWRGTDYFPMRTDSAQTYVWWAGVAARYSAKFEAWQARAALAQPSPAPELEAIAQEMEPLPTKFAQVIEDHLQELLIKGEPAPELERPEVVAWMWRDLSGDVQFNYMHPEGQELMTVAQHDRIVGVLRFERQQMDRAFTACINERDELRGQCDAALAKLAAMEQQEPSEYRCQHEDGRIVYLPYKPTGPWDCQPLYRRPVAQAGQVPEGLQELLSMLVVHDLRKIRYAGSWRKEVHNRAAAILEILAAAPHPAKDGGQ